MHISRITSLFLILCLLSQAPHIQAADTENDFISTKTHVNTIQLPNPTLPNIPLQRGRMGDIMSKLFDGEGRIGNWYIKALRNTQNNSVMRWSGGKGGLFTTGSIFDTGAAVGIGTSSPQSKLEVVGNQILSGDARKIFIGGTSTYIGEFGTSNMLEFSGGGSESADSVFVDSEGKIGVGNPSPAYDLDVSGSINLTGTLYNDGNPVVFSGKFVDGATPTDAVYTTGSVGIGTTSPSSGLTLDVEGKIGASEYCDVNGTNCFTTSVVALSGSTVGGSGTQDFITKFTSTGDIGNSIIQENGGRIGISTVPTHKLDVDGNIRTRADIIATDGAVLTDNIGFTNIEPGDINSDGRVGFDSSRGIIVYRTQQPGDESGSETYTVLDTANIAAGTGITISNTAGGIAGTEPITFSLNNGNIDADTLDGIDSTGFIQIGTSGDQIQDGTIDASEIQNDSIVNIDINSSAAIDGTKISPNFGNQNVVTIGNVGIGIASPGTDLHVRGGASGQTPTNLDGLFVENNGNLNSYYVFQTATTGGGKSFSVTNAGNVGIGTTGPGERLSVTGRISVTGNPNSDDDVGDRLYNDGRYINVGETISGDDITDGTIDSSEIQDNTITESDISDSFVARDSNLLDGINSTAFIRSDANDNVTANTQWQDNNEIRLGNGSDLRLFHDGTNSHIRNYTGIFRIGSYSHGSPIQIQGEDNGGTNRNIFVGDPDGAANMYYAGTEKISSSSAGANIAGILSVTGDPDSADDVGDRGYNDGRYLNVGEAINGDDITDGTIDSSEIQNNTITADDLAINSVGSSELSDILTYSDSVASEGFNSIHIDHNASGSDVLSTDRHHRGLFINMDSSATGGDIVNEHRVYGIESDVSVSGDSDLVYGGYFNADSTHSLGTITHQRGAFGHATSNGTATVTNLSGGYNLAVDSSNGTVGEVFGTYSRALKDTGSTNTTATIIGSHNEVEIDAGTITNAYGTRSLINRDGGTITNGYLFFGDYTGTLPTNAYGVYITDPVDNYFAGNIGIGTASPQEKQHIFGGSNNAATLYTTDTTGNTASDGLWAGYSNMAYLWNYEDTDIRFATNNIEQVTIENTGDVGFGVTNPTADLHIADTRDAVILLEADTDDVNEEDNARIIMRQDDGLVQATIGFVNNNDRFEIMQEFTDELSLGTSGVDRIRIQADGDVGIGTNNPSEKLHVVGNSLTTGHIYSTGRYMYGDGKEMIDWDDTWLRLNQNGDFTNGIYTPNNLRVDGSIYVGDDARFYRSAANTIASDDLITTTSQIEAGRASGSVAMTTNDGHGNANLAFNHRSGVPDANGNAARISVNTDDTTDAQIDFQVGQNVTAGVAAGIPSVMTLEATGEVGIGTTNPTSALHIMDTNSIVRSQGTAGYGSFYAIGSGTNPSYMFFGNAAGEKGRITSTDAGDLVFGNGVTTVEHMRIEPTGDVGIGTNNPSEKLQVSGNIMIGRTDSTGGSLLLYGTTAGKYSRLRTTNGDFHLDSGFGTGGGNTMYLNYYNGGDISFGNGASGVHSTATTAGNWAFGGSGTFGGHVYSNGVYYYGDGKEIIDFNSTWLRLNQNGDFTDGTFTPGLFRANGGVNVGDDEGFYRSAEDVVRTDDTFVANPRIAVGGILPSGNLASGNSIVIGDSDTGFKQNGDGQLSAYANNQERMSITVSGVRMMGSNRQIDDVTCIGNCY